MRKARPEISGLAFIGLLFQKRILLWLTGKVDKRPFFQHRHGAVMENRELFWRNVPQKLSVFRVKFLNLFRGERGPNPSTGSDSSSPAFSGKGNRNVENALVFTGEEPFVAGIYLYGMTNLSSACPIRVIP